MKWSWRGCADVAEIQTKEGEVRAEKGINTGDTPELSSPYYGSLIRPSAQN
jgi:hypothetical protein